MRGVALLARRATIRLALARSPDRHGLEAFHDLVGGVLDELRLHPGYAARWEIDPRQVEPSPATRAYTDFLLATAALGTLGELCAALTPCMRLYAFLGQSIATARTAPPDHPYRTWIDTYAALGFDALAARLEELLDRYAEDGARVRSTYRRAMELELGFFDAHTPEHRPPPSHTP